MAMMAMRMQRALDAERRQQQELMREYGIDSSDPDCWKRLAMALAKKFHPRYRRKRGRARKWTLKKRMILLMNVAVQKGLHPKLSDEQILQRLVDLPDGPYTGYTVPALEKQLTEARRDPHALLAAENTRRFVSTES